MPSSRSIAGEHGFEIGERRSFLMMTTVIPVDPKFFCLDDISTEDDMEVEDSRSKENDREILYGH